MSDTYGTIPSFFSTGPSGGGALTYDQLQARRKIAEALATRNRGFPKNIGEGLTYLGEALGENMADRRLAAGEAAFKVGDDAARRALMGGDPVAAPPAAPAAPAPRPQAIAPGDDPMQAMAMAVTGPEAAVQSPAEVLAPGGVLDSGQPITPVQAAQQPSMSIEEWKQRTARNETGGKSNPYQTVGERSRRGDYPYGKYQVMGENVPKWTKGYLGREMTPDEFLKDPEAQEQLVTAKGNEYLTKYGPNGAAAAWFAGEKGMNDPKRKDTLGTHVAEYQRRFNIPLVSREQVVASAAQAPAAASFAPEERPMQLASLGGAPQSDTMPDPARDAIARTLAPAPAQQVAQARPALPQAPPAVPLQVQQAPQEERPTPAGPEPTLRNIVDGNPQLRQQMETARRYALDPNVSPATQALAKQRFEDLNKEANNLLTKQWTTWHERSKGEEAFRLGREERQRAREAHDKAQQGRITGAATLPPVDPRVLGTDQSPQRTRIPSPPPKPADVTQEQWSAQQAPLLAKAVTAADEAEPDFKSMLRVIDEVRAHPGKKWGTGLTAGYAPRGTDAYAFSGGPEEGVIGQLKGKTFLSAYDKLRGGGAIATVEGTKAQQAQAAINPAAGEAAVDKALDNLEKQIRSDLEVVQRRTNRPVTAWQKSNEDEVAPDKGQIVGGFKDGKTREYLGGDPRDIGGSWRIVR